ncbi:MAG TPA: hypothetical protein VIV11_23415 [Kofleriaceae bacterium]
MGRFSLAWMFVVAMVGSSSAQEAPPPVDEQSQFDAAFDAMLRGDFAAASNGFKQLAGTAASPERRASSADLARLADELLVRGGRLTYAGAPGAPAAPLAPSADVVPVSEDDAVDGGRASFVITTTMASFYSGFVLLDLLDTDDLRTGTLVVMASTAGGVVGSLYGTRGRTMTGGMADAWRLGLFAGVGNALLLSGPIGLFDAETNSSEKVNTFVLASGWGAATAGLLIADSIRPTRGQVTVVETFGLMGIASTLLSLAIVQPDDVSGNTFLTITAAGLDGGLAAGAAFGGKLDWSHARSRYVELSAFLGGLAGGGTSLLLFAESGDDNTLRAAAAITLAGLWGGFALGTHLTRDMAPDFRFRRAQTTTAITPTSIRNAPGLALTGMF